MKIFVYGYANTPFFFNEVFKLSKKLDDKIEWGIIYPQPPYKSSSNDILNVDNIFYLYNNFNKIFKNNSRDVKYNFLREEDNIHRMIAGSKHGYNRYNSRKQERNANIIYQLYKSFLVKNTPNYIIFPDVETADGLILLNICKELEICILYNVHTRYLGQSFFAQDAYETLPIFFGDYNDNNLLKSKNIIHKYHHNELSPFNLKTDNLDIIKIELPNIFQRFFSGVKNTYKFESNAIIESKISTKLLKLIPTLRSYFLMLKFNLFQKKYFNSLSKKDIKLNKFIFFPLQMTPESSINTLESYFIDQLKLIDLIRLNMPHNYFLIVKEHPVMIGERKSDFYSKINKKSGVILVDNELSTKFFFNNASLIISITGTVGLEAYLDDKRILMFGPTFFSHLCDRHRSYEKIKKEISNAINNENKKTNKILEIAKILNISYDFILNDPLFYSSVMSKSNIKNFLLAVKNHIKRLENS